jgi:DNA primase
MGTALTEQQLKLLKRYTDKFVLALDADTAGMAATLRGINAARDALDEQVPVLTGQRGLIRYENRLSVELKIATVPIGKDPDDLLRENPAEWESLLSKARPLVDYYMTTIITDLDLESARGKTMAVQQILPVIRELGDPVAQDHYLQQLARLIRIDERTLRTELDRQSPSEKKTERERIATKPVQTQFEKKLSASSTTHLEEYCLAMLIGHPAALMPINERLEKLEIGSISANDFLKTENQALFEIVERWAFTENRELDALLAMTESHLEGHLASMMALWHQQPTALAEYIERE